MTYSSLIKSHYLINGLIINEYNNKSFSVSIPELGNRNIHRDVAKYLISQLKVVNEK